MIIKGQARGRAVQLAAHLLSAEQNESVRLYECRGTLAKDVTGALTELEARGLAARSKRPLYHASISPEPSKPLDDRQISHAIDTLEAKLGLNGQPRIVVVHRKKNREHIHVVWSRIDAETGTAIAYSWNYRLHERAARELEAAFGHRRIASSSRTSMRRGAARPAAGYELRQADRSGISPAAISSEVTALWHGSRSGNELKRRLEEAGYVLARGDRRVFVLIDRAGNVHSLARRIHGADTAQVRARLRDIDLGSLPSVAAVRGQQQTMAKVHGRRRNFARVSREVTGNRSNDRLTAYRAATDVEPNLLAVTAIKDASAGRPPARRSSPDQRLSHIIYRSVRAALFSDFATRMAAARRYLSGDQLIAALAALEAERNAALDNLRSGQRSKNRDVRPRTPRRIRVTTPSHIRRKPRGLR